MESHIPPHIDKLYAEKQAGNFSCDMTSSSVQLINAPIPSKLFKELQAMASEVNKDASCLAGELLGIAIQEALDSLPENNLRQLESIMLASQQASVNKTMNDAIYDPGAT